MEINISNKEIVDEIISSLKTNKSLSLVRLGDGEMIVAENLETISSFCIKQVGRVLSETELKIVRDNITNGIINCDILGIPKPIQIENFWPLKNIFNYISNIKVNNAKNWKEKRYCINNAHMDLLNTNCIFEILSNVESLCIVSSRDITNKIKIRFPNIKNIEYYSIPGEQSFEVVKNTKIDILPLIDKISNELKSKDRHGQLLIYGCGPFGKNLGNIFASVGGVSIDLGSVLDLFVGKVTRGKGKGATVLTDPRL
jgi:hypothetical protein